MKSKQFLQLIMVCFCIFFSFKLSAQEISQEEAINWSNDKGAKLLETFQEEDLNKKFALLDDMFLNYVDLDYISKFVIGKHWRGMNADQQIGRAHV